MKPATVSNNFRFSAKAKKDLLQIARHTELKRGRSQRDHYIKQLDQAFSLIAENPKLGTNRSHVLTGYRSFQQASQVIYYRELAMIEIIRILHKQMDVGLHFKKA